MNYSDLTRKLRRMGGRYQRSSRGSHELWTWQEKQLAVTIPNQAAREIPPGTLAAILERLDFTEHDLNNA